MERQEELGVGRRLLGHVGDRTTDLSGSMLRNSVSAYFCRARANLEHERLFRDRPIFMGLASRLAKPGDYFTEDVAGMPILVVRDTNGEVKAFGNVCRHRGAPVAQGCGNARAFTCPYHGWTYDLAGRLLGTTDKVGFAGIDLAGHGLPRLAAAESHGMLFVRPKPVREGEPLKINVDSDLGTLAAELALLRLDTYSMFSADRVNPRINWKVAIDTFLEGYHIPHLHQKTIAPYFVGNCGTFDASGPNGRMCLGLPSLGDLRDIPESQRNYRQHLFPIYQLFPNNILIWQPDHIQIWRAFPGHDNPSRCDVEMTIYKPADSSSSDADLEANREIILRTVMEEDFLLSERMQIGFESGAIDEVIYGRNEPALVHFHASIRNALGIR
jgi:phenylpropionate dioxygenase-like ring-hydroxylating dioxygenase large terminal subunit